MTTAKISKRTASTLDYLHRKYHRPKTVLIELAVTQLEEHLLLQDINNAYLRLKAHPKEWAEELQERSDLEGTIEDGLNDA